MNGPLQPHVPPGTGPPGVAGPVPRALSVPVQVLLAVGFWVVLAAVLSFLVWFGLFRENLQGLQQPQGGVGQAVREGDLEFTVTDVVNRVGDATRGEPAGPYAVIEVTVRNVGDKPRDLVVEHQEFYDSRGWDHRHSERGAGALGADTRSRYQLNPGSQEDIVLVVTTLRYDQPVEAVEFHVEEDSRGVLVPVA